MLSLDRMRRLNLALFALVLIGCGATPPAVTAVALEQKGATYSLKLQYPVVEGASAALNKQLADTALTHLEQVEDDPVPFAEYAKNIAQESAGGNWVFESVMTIAHQSPSILTTLCKAYTNTGAAHPNTFHYYEVYDLTTGKRLELSDLIEDGKLPALRALAKVTEDYPNEPEIGLLKDSLVFRPDPDARMVLDSQIPYAQLKGILKSKYLP